MAERKDRDVRFAPKSQSGVGNGAVVRGDGLTEARFLVLLRFVFDACREVPLAQIGDRRDNSLSLSLGFKGKHLVGCIGAGLPDHADIEGPEQGVGGV